MCINEPIDKWYHQQQQESNQEHKCPKSVTLAVHNLEVQTAQNVLGHP